MTNTQNRRKKVSKPKIFNEKREAMWLIESASPIDIYIWCFCIVAMFSLIVGSLALAYSSYYN